MDSKLRLLEERRGVERDSDSAVLKVEFRDLNLDDPDEYWDFIGVFGDYWTLVNEDDGFEVIEWHRFGEPDWVMRAEAMLNFYVTQGCQIQVAISEGRIVGFLMYQNLFNYILVVRHMYFDEACRDKGVGAKTLDSLSFDFEKVLFQTRKSNPPEQMLKVTEPYRSKVAESDEMITWEMSWR